MACCNIIYVVCAVVYLSLQHCLGTVHTNNEIFLHFDHFQVFTIVKVCCTIKLYLTDKMTLNMQSF